MIKNIGFKPLGQHAPEPDAAAKHSLLDLHVRKLAAQPAKATSTVFIVVGTRPELIKLAPVIRRFKESPHFITKVVNTGQHVELVDTLYSQLGITPDYNCELLEKGQSLVSLYARALERLGKLIAENPPDVILVQGDTLSAAAAAFVGFLNLIPVGHVEAGLRTFNILSPFPEELNRILIGQVATFHFAPARRGVENLLQAGVPASDVFLVGNTVVDALQDVSKEIQELSTPAVTEFFRANASKRTVLLTMHRRENQDGKLDLIFAAIAELAAQYENQAAILFPMHFTPLIRQQAQKHFGNSGNILLCEPIEYLEFVTVLRRVDFIISDSGGIQEEALALNKPILILRENTERMEIVDSGLGQLVGNDLELFKKRFTELVADPQAAVNKAVVQSRPYGIGEASGQIRQVVEDFLSGRVASGTYELSVVVPCFNEEGNIGTIMERLVQVTREAKINAEIIFVDDNSADTTYAVGSECAWRYGNVRVMTKTHPRGMGNAIRFGLSHASADVVIVTMGDGSDDLSVLPDLYRKIRFENFDLAIGSRYRHRSNMANIPVIYRFFSSVFRMLGNFILGIPVRDFTNAYRAFNWKVLKRIGLEGTGFEISPEITFKAWYLRQAIAEVDAKHLKRTQGQSKFSFLKAGPGYAKMMTKALITRFTKSWPYIDW